jgi:hypothetical protein
MFSNATPLPSSSFQYVDPNALSSTASLSCMAYPKLTYLSIVDNLRCEEDIDPIGYILNGASLLQQFHTRRLRPNWMTIIRHMKHLTHLSIQCPLPNGTNDIYLSIYTDDIETTHDDFVEYYEAAWLKLSQNSSIRVLTIKWNPDHCNLYGNDQEENLDWIVRPVI